MKTREVQENLELAQTILGQWLRYRQYFLKGVSEEPISPDEEQEFLETTSAVAQNIRKMGQHIDERTFPFRKNEIAAQLKGIISVQHFRNLSQADRKTFYKDWYASMVYLTRTVGGLKFLNEGYRPLVKRKRRRGKKMSGKVGFAVVVIILAALAAGWYLFI